MSYPVESGFVKSLAHPGTNITGITYFRDVGLDGKRLELLKEVVPSTQRVILLFDGSSSKENPTSIISLEAIRKIAARLGIKLIEKPVQSVAEAEQVVSFYTWKNYCGSVYYLRTSIQGSQENCLHRYREKIPLNRLHSAAGGRRSSSKLRAEYVSHRPSRGLVRGSDLERRTTGKFTGRKPTEVWDGN
jgi:ABC-type uncharacterized transport system substrate-binding protein